MNEANCGKCFFWLHVQPRGADVEIGSARKGNCYGSPPTPYVAKLDQFGAIRAQGNMRAVVAENERACGMFADAEQVKELQRQANGGAANG